MFDKKRALICSIILYSCGAVAFIVFLIGSVILKAFPPKMFTFLPIMFIMFFLGAIFMTFVYFRLKKQSTTKVQVTPIKENDFPDEEFYAWLEKFEPFTKFGALLTETPEKCFSKFGGLPIVPKNFVWPLYDNHPIPFLLQVDFEEINKEKSLTDFPTGGLMYVFADSEDINQPDFVDGEEPYKEGRTFKILFFDKTSDIATATKPDLLETVYKEFHVSSNIVKSYPDIDDCKEACDLYCDRPFGGADDAYDELQNENFDTFMIGGWAVYVQGGGYMESLKENENDEWILLMQLCSVVDDSNFMWGDNGSIYFYIRREDLKAKNFNNVKFDMQCF